MNIFDYTDAYQFLREYYAAKKGENPNFSHRFVGEKVGFSPGYFSRILSGEKKLSTEMTAKFSEFLKFKGRSADYFEALVGYTQSESDDQKNRFYTKMLSLKKSKTKALEKETYQLFDTWYHSVVFSALKVIEVGDATDLQTVGKHFMPPISREQIEKSLRLLLRLGLIVKNGVGNYSVVNSHLSTGDKPTELAIRNYLRTTIDLAHEAVESVPIAQRSMSTMIVSVSETGYEKIKGLVAKMREEIHAVVAAESGVDRIYHINTNLYPVFTLDKGKVS